MLLASQPATATDYTYGNEEFERSTLDGACRFLVDRYGALRNKTYEYAGHYPDGGGWNCGFYDDFYHDGRILVYTAGFVVRHGDGVVDGGSQQSGSGTACPFCKAPINPGNGNMWHDERDYDAIAPGHLTLSRTYNSNLLSLDAKRNYLFGNRWSSPYDSWLRQEVPAAQNAPVGTCTRNPDTNLVSCYVQTVAAQAAIPAAVSVSRSDGKRIFFNRNGGGWIPSSDIADSISAIFNTNGDAVIGWLFQSAAQGTTEKFDASGKLLSIAYADGRTLRMTYSVSTTYDTTVARYPSDAPACAKVHPSAPVKDRLLCVSDDWRRQLNFEYDATGRVSKMHDPAGEPYVFNYDGASGGCVGPLDAQNAALCGANNLTSIVYPGNKTKTYHYNELSQINGGGACDGLPGLASDRGPLANALTRLDDENGAHQFAWTYDCFGRATSSYAGSGIDKVELAYGPRDSNGKAVTTVTHYTGSEQNPVATVTPYVYMRVLGMDKNVSMEQNCIECGAVAARTYDANANPGITTDWSGAQTKYTYDQVRNLETTRIEAFGTPLARTITTEWHAVYRLPKRIAEPKRITTFEYFANGDLKTRALQATTDMSGAQAFGAALVGPISTTTYTYNSNRQLETITGPRAGGIDKTTYTYDPATGNLSTIRNAAGHTTTFGDYDGNGRARLITAPNGATTRMSYTPRGWLEKRTVSDGTTTSLTTTYAYDNVGQVTSITMPDNSSVTYIYDDAHRLTDVKDSIGNTIHYTLNSLGSREREEVRDPQGNLRRQVAREFDNLNRVKVVTGGAQ